MGSAPLTRSAGRSHCRWLASLLLPISLATYAASPAVSRETFRAQLSSAQGVVNACRAGTCNSRNLPSEEDVQPEGPSPAFHTGWQWLRDAVEGAAKLPASSRSAAMAAATAHLDELAQEAAGNPASLPEASAMPAAHAAAAAILARAEFRTESSPTWLDRQLARLQDALLRLLFGMAGIGSRNAWIAPLVEWLCFGLAAAGLLFFIRRSLHRQALRIALAGSAGAVAAAGRSAADWLHDADAAEAAGNGREAIHCLYWAAIASLEARKAWRPNPTRTPREYLRLLGVGSASERSLRALTRRFESAWYGSTEPSAEQIQSARADYAHLEGGLLDRLGLPDPKNPSAAPSSSPPLSPGLTG